jgi:predicted ester cyclase
LFDRRIVLLALISAVILACDSQPPAVAPLEDNKAIVRQFFQAIDESRGSLDFVDEWMTPDFRTYFNSPDALDLAGYRQFMSEALDAFPQMRHEIHYMVAENDLVAAGITLHMVHTGEYLGIAPTGRPVSVEEMVVVRLRDGKIAEEWVVFDFATLQQQLAAPTTAPQ